jgi:hypothetical protein
MNLPTAIVTATGMLCGTALLLVVMAMIWMTLHRQC